MKLQKSQPNKLVDNFDLVLLDELIEFEENENLSEEDLKDFEMRKSIGDLF